MPVTRKPPAFHAAPDRLARELSRLLPEGFATPAARAAWHAAGMALGRGAPVDAPSLCAPASDAATVLELQHRVLEALRRAAEPGLFAGLFANLGRSARELPAALRAALWPATVAALTQAIAVAQPEPIAAPAPENASTPDIDPIDDLQRQSNWLLSATERTATAANQVSDACGVVLQAAAMAFVGINTNADISVELQRSIESITEQLARTADASVEASTSADLASTEIAQLKEAATRIGSVTDLIRSIAGQTNLLALNATIEAARAGEAGKGFAVVASEVKALARQTADATAQIGAVINEIRGAVAAAAERVQGIQRATAEVRQLTSAGAKAVEQQRNATTEISTASSDAAQAVAQMQEGIEQVASDCFALSTAISELTSGSEIMTAKVARLQHAA